MTYKQFEDLPVWEEAARLYAAADEFLDHEPSPVSRGFRDQLDRAALSVSNNIAEGFERGTTAELLQFIYIARGSAGEVRSMLSVLERAKRAKRFSADLKSEISNLNFQIAIVPTFRSIRSTLPKRPGSATHARSRPMPEILQNTLHLNSPGACVVRDNLTLQVEVPVYPDSVGLAPHECAPFSYCWRR